MPEHRDNRIDWLREAYAMEQQAEQMLEPQTARTENCLRLKARRIGHHVEETLWQQNRIDDCLERYGTKPSVTNWRFRQFRRNHLGRDCLMCDSKILKWPPAPCLTPQLDLDTVQVIDEILPQERAMAKWMLGPLPEPADDFFARDATPDVEGKR